MKLTIPVYVEERKRPGQEDPLVAVRPVFFEQPIEHGSTVDRAVARLLRTLREDLHDLGAKQDQTRLAAWGFCPDFEEETVSFTLEIGQRRSLLRYLVVSYRDLGRRLAFTPTLPDLWFEIGRGQSLAGRAEEVLTRHFKDLAKKAPDGRVEPRHLGEAARAWTTTAELRVTPSTTVEKAEAKLMAMLGGAEVRDGATELRSVGRCLEWLYPNDLDRAAGREREVAELERLLQMPDRRPVLMVGPRLVGKTAIAHEYVFRRARAHGSAFKEKRNTWLLAPQRLISGMSFVGQWEHRLIEILKESKRREHTLYFDDLVGLYSAGTHRDSNLSVAHVLKPYVERREVRVLGEATPEQFRVLREIDRGFADLFHVLQVEEMGEEATLRVLVALERELERSTGCRFHVDALPTVLDLQRRFARDAALPGKAAVFFRPLATKHRNAEITRAHALEEFGARSGLSVAFLDRDVVLDRQAVVDTLGFEIVGQHHALETAADVVSLAKARLNDPERPLASLLFLGPTGVGKTQTAKALATYLFGDEERLVRFDMNEYVSPGSAARLVGTFGQPEGLLTSAIRRQPFAVLLLDEIEKAHPEVFDLLLQVLGEGRLTDALGRTADFTNAIVILTSNLGVKEAMTRPGFAADDREGAAYTRAAERFFRPEFFNRLDRVVPFERLRREDVARIARILIGQLFDREGLARRRCELQLGDEVVERVVEEGFHPTLGARALKRAVERQLAAPLALRLALLSPDEPTILRVTAPRGEIDVEVQGLENAPPREEAELLALMEPGDVLARLGDALARLEEIVDAARPEGPLDVDEIDTEHVRYFAAREQLQRASRMLDWAEGQLARPPRGMSLARPPSGGAPRTKVERHEAGRGRSLRQIWKEVLAADDARAYVKGLSAEPLGESLDTAAAEVAREAALLEAIVAGDGGAAPVWLVLESLASGRPETREEMVARYVEAFDDRLGLSAEPVEKTLLPPYTSAVAIRGPHALEVARVEEGTHLVLGDGRFEPLAVFVHTAGEIPRERRRFEPVVRIYTRSGPAVDLRTGLASESRPTAQDVRRFVLAMLDLPEELV